MARVLFFEAVLSGILKLNLNQTCSGFGSCRNADRRVWFRRLCQ
jgi:hypothetical protein